VALKRPIKIENISLRVSDNSETELTVPLRLMAQWKSFFILLTNAAVPTGKRRRTEISHNKPYVISHQGACS